MTNDATVEQHGDLYVVRFERWLNHPIERVWAALTDPQQLPKWLAAAEIDPQPNGRYLLHFQNVEHTHVGRVIRYEPPRLFEHTFGEDANGVVRWELTPHGETCQLNLSHTVYSTDELANFMSGWHTHLELLDSLFKGAPEEWDWDRWIMHKERYAKRVRDELGLESKSPRSCGT